MTQMLLRADLSEKLARVHRSIGAPTAQQRAEFMAARAARPKYAASVAGARPSASADPENYCVVGSVAQICVAGVLSEEPDFWAWLMGCDGSTYEDIRDAFALAAADPLVKSVVLDVCSPGGYTEGLFETLAAIELFGNTKPVTVQASEACSAAYALAAMAGPITPKGPASQFGSIGVAMSFDFYTEIETVDLTSTAAPNKRPDPRTPEGKAVIVEYLDSIHELFADAIARGRSNSTGKKYTVAMVNSDFGKGAMMLADDAYAAGLIDKKPKATKRGGPSAEADHASTIRNAPGSVIASSVATHTVGSSPETKFVAGDRVESLVDHMPGMKGMVGEVEIVRTEPAYYGVRLDGETATHKWLAEDEIKAAPAAASASAKAPGNQSPPRSAGQETKKVTRMTKEELLAQFPQLHAALLAEGAAQGQALERKRVGAHIKMGKTCGAMDVAEQAIASGASLQDDDIFAEYQTAAINKRSVAVRQEESDEAGAALEGAKSPTAQTLDNGDKVAAAMGLPVPKKTAA